MVPYLNNPSEEAIFESNKIKEEHKVMKLQNEEVMLKHVSLQFHAKQQVYLLSLSIVFMYLKILDSIMQVLCIIKMYKEPHIV